MLQRMGKEETKRAVFCVCDILNLFGIVLGVLAALAAVAFFTSFVKCP